jgi:hypothetical protein
LTRAARKERTCRTFFKLQTFISHAWKAHSWSSSSSCVACVLQCWSLSHLYSSCQYL